ncbi:pentapeptide repeat-containing protein [Halorubrum aquaticum]|uniref:pentapeptide repeat-containing protein n=1 Tax=Halorubrum aquaticum TaxID=387340 RepID=UPI0031D3D382
MIEYGEELLKQRLWSWLETDRGMAVEGEVGIETGRIDLVARTPGNEIWGIELKRGGFSSYEQAGRYLESGYLDRLYIASNSVKTTIEAFQKPHPINQSTLNQTSRKLGAGVVEGRYTQSEVMEAVDDRLDATMLNRKFGGEKSVRKYIKHRIRSKPGGSKTPIPLEIGVETLARARFPTELGVIQIPLPLSNSKFRNAEKHISPDQAPEPQILREADTLNREYDPTFSRREEPWVRHSLWKHFGGLPEGHIPNVKDSDQPHRPIDLIAFEGSYDPSDVVKAPESNEILGIEAKGESSSTLSRVDEQLSEYLRTSTLSRLYLAVPVSMAGQATERLSENNELLQVGLLTVAEDGTVAIQKEAGKLQVDHDGYLSRHSKHKTGFGSVSIPGGKIVQSPYVTDEEADRLANKDADKYASQLLTDNSILADDSGRIRTDRPTELRPPESEHENLNEARYGFSDTIRAYLLRGRAADPYGPHGEEPIPKDGYVRLRIEEFKSDQETLLKFHFGRGSGEGGYIWFHSDQLDTLLSVLVSIDTIEGGTIHGQGKFIDLDTFPFNRDENPSHKLTGGHGQEEIIKIRIDSIEPDQAPKGHVLPMSHEDKTKFPFVNENTKIRLQLGTESHQGVNVTMTEAQWLDLIATVDILRTENQLRLPGEHHGTPRIGPSGRDTWSLGSEIERQINPDPPAESEVPERRCRYTYPENFNADTEPSPSNQNSCARKPLPDADRCKWHADPANTQHKAEAIKQTDSIGDSLDGSILSGELTGSVDFTDVSLLRDVDFSDANLSHASLRNVDLSNANLRDADLTRADLYKSDLSNAELSGANLRNADLSNADLTYAHLIDADLDRAFLQLANLARSNLKAANLKGAALTQVDFRDAELSRANFTHAELTKANLTHARVISTDLTNANLFGANFTEAKIMDPDLTDTDLRNANFDRAELTSVDISSANTKGSDFSIIRGGASGLKE